MRKTRTFAIGICLAFFPMLSGCNDLVLTNVVAGLQEGAITTTTGIINTFFEVRLPVEVPMSGKEGGDDLFVQM